MVAACYNELSCKEIAGKIADVPWGLKGFLVLNLCIALCTASWIQVRESVSDSQVAGTRLFFNK